MVMKPQYTPAMDSVPLEMVMQHTVSVCIWCLHEMPKPVNVYIDMQMVAAHGTAENLNMVLHFKCADKLRVALHLPPIQWEPVN